MLGIALVFGRFPSPGGSSFGYGSFARNLAIFALLGALARAPGVTFARSRIGPALLVFLLAGASSIAVNGGGWGDLRTLATTLGIFYAARAVADGPRGSLWLFHWLGLLSVGVLAREVLHNPAVLGMREIHRFTLVTDNANTLGAALALSTPVFLAATQRPERRAAAWVYAVCSSLTVVASFSRAAWLALALGVGALGFAMRRRQAPLGSLASALASVAVVVIAIGYLSLGRAEADAQRLRIMATSMSLFREHWLSGIGLGIHNLEQLFPIRYLELYGESLFLFHSHNFYVDLLTGTGVIGALAATWLLGTLVRVAWLGITLASRPEERLDALAYASALGIFLVISVTDMPFYHGRIVLLLAILWAMMESACRERASPERALLRRSIAGAQKSGSSRHDVRKESAPAL